MFSRYTRAVPLRFENVPFYVRDTKSYAEFRGLCASKVPRLKVCITVVGCVRTCHTVHLEYGVLLMVIYSLRTRNFS